ncbi:MAG TPA: glycosyltransferase family 4 protein [Anaerolineales bacterium]|nr:glycosyltransferase family 4 protein [Anaerolineales bacterium]
MMRFPGRLGLQQRVLPAYRAPFFDLLASACDDGMSLFAGLPRPVEGIATTDKLKIASYHRGKNIHLFREGLYVCYQSGLVNWLKKWDPDALIVEANPRYLSTPEALRWMKRRGRPVIGWGLGAPPLSGFLSGLRNRRRALFLKHFDALIAYSQRGADEYAVLGFPREKIYIAHNSVSRAPASMPDDRPLTVDRFTVLFVGRLQRRKRIDSLLRACAESEEKPRLVIVGDGPEREKLQDLAREIYPEAEFAGAKHGEELKPYFMLADLFVLPGTGGLAVQQAMSYGLPVIVAQGDGTQDDLVRSENGWQIPPGDLKALLFTMNEALSDVARLRRMGKESYRIVEEEINVEKMVETFVIALNAVAGK